MPYARTRRRASGRSRILRGRTPSATSSALSACSGDRCAWNAECAESVASAASITRAAPSPVVAERSHASRDSTLTVRSLRETHTS